MEGLKVLDVGHIMEGVKHALLKNTPQKIENNPAVADDQINDHNNIEIIMKTK